MGSIGIDISILFANGNECFCRNPNSISTSHLCICKLLVSNHFFFSTFMHLNIFRFQNLDWNSFDDFFTLYSICIPSCNQMWSLYSRQYML